MHIKFLVCLLACAAQAPSNMASSCANSTVGMIIERLFCSAVNFLIILNYRVLVIQVKELPMDYYLYCLLAGSEMHS